MQNFDQNLQMMKPDSMNPMMMGMGMPYGQMMRPHIPMTGMLPQMMGMPGMAPMQVMPRLMNMSMSQSDNVQMHNIQQDNMMTNQ
jgi:hypothetical protein